MIALKNSVNGQAELNSLDTLAEPEVQNEYWVKMVEKEKRKKR